MNNNIKAPCRYDFVGSFLRPDYLKKARADFEKGAITAQQLKEVEDKAILDLVAKQKRLVIISSQTASSAEQHGILTLCGASMALVTARHRQVCHSMARPQ